MEKELFSWEDWDVIDELTFIYNNVVLKQKIGDFGIGTKLTQAEINYEKGTLKLYTVGEKYIEYKLKLSIMEE